MKAQRLRWLGHVERMSEERGVKQIYKWKLIASRSVERQNIGWIKKKQLHGLSPRANYTDRATAACRRSDCQLVRIEDATWSA
jgi:hypothetical protein